MQFYEYSSQLGEMPVLKKGYYMRRVHLEVYGEICCEECNEIIHNHFDCPACNQQYAGTDAFRDIENDDVLTCDCGAQFKLLSDYWYGGCDAEWLNAPQDTEDENGHITQQPQA